MLDTRRCTCGPRLVGVAQTEAGSAGTMAVTTLPETPVSAADNILVTDTSPVPMVLMPCLGPGPPICAPLALLLIGTVLARGLRTVTTWIRAAGLSDSRRILPVLAAQT